MPQTLPAVRSDAAIWEMVQANLGLCRAFAVRLAKSASGIVRKLGGVDEVTSLATLGLYRAARVFDPARGVRFSAFAWHYLRATVFSALADSDFIRVPRHLPAEERQALRERLAPVSLFQRWQDGHREDAAAPAAPEADEDLAAVREAVEGLPPRLRRVIRLRYYDGKTLEQIGHAVGVTRERARQLVEQALEELRLALSAAEAPAVG
jgi:RNA polymerase primary sigma factor